MPSSIPSHPTNADFSGLTGYLCKTADNPATYACLVDKKDGNAAPTGNDDSANTSGKGAFSVGSLWVDVTNNKAYICVDAAATAAVWVECGGGGGAASHRGSLSMGDNATATTIAVIGTAVKAAGTTVAGPLSSFTHANNRLTYMGTDTADFLITASGSVKCAMAGKELSWMLYKNGALVGAANELEAGIGAGTTGSGSLTALVSLATNDYLEVWLVNDESTDNITLVDLNLVVTRADKIGLTGATGAAGAAGADGDITWQGAWATATAYTTNQAVKHGGASYVCILNHTSSATDEPGSGASWQTYWDVMASKGDAGPAGVYGADYAEVVNRAQQSMSSATYADVLSYTCPSGLNGTYRVEVNGFAWNADKLGYHRLYNDTDAVEEYSPFDLRIKTNSLSLSMSFDIVLSGSAKTFKWQFKDDIGTNTQYVKEARMRFYRVL